MDTLALIRKFEGYRDTPYWDVNAYRTGYGSDTVTMADGSIVPVRQGMTITREDAERDLARRVNSEFVPRVISQVGQERFAAMTPAQQAALASIAYNYGSLPKSLVSAVQGGGDVASAIRGLGSHNEGINRNRRNTEADIFSGAASLPEGGYAAYPGGMPPTQGNALSGQPAPGQPQNTLAANQPERPEFKYNALQMTPYRMT